MKSKPSAGRAQTEPVATLVAVISVCLAVSLYTGVHTAILSELGRDRAPDSVTTERIWQDLTQSGVIYNGTDLEDRIDPETIPRGFHVRIEVTYIGPTGEVERLAGTTFDNHGIPVEVETPPEDASTYERPVSVQEEPGEIRPGSLAVVIWK